jgi:hypothetical protein
MSATSDRPNPLDRPDTSTQTAQIDRSTPGGDGIDRYCVGQLYSMSEATEVILIAYKLLHQSMKHLTRTNVIKQETMAMSDGSTLTYNINITIQTDQEHSIAYKKIKYLNNFSLIEPMELSLVGLLCDCPEGDEDDPEQQELEVIQFYKDGGHKQEGGDLLTADQDPEDDEDSEEDTDSMMNLPANPRAEDYLIDDTDQQPCGKTISIGSSVRSTKNGQTGIVTDFSNGEPIVAWGNGQSSILSIDSLEPLID